MSESLPLPPPALETPLDSMQSLNALEPSLEATLVNPQLVAMVSVPEEDTVDPETRTAQSPPEAVESGPLPLSPPIVSTSIPVAQGAEIAEPVKDKISPASFPETPTQIVADPTPNKWRDWLQSTTEQLAKNVQDRSTRAYDAISAVTTSSGSIRKRKKTSKSLSGEAEEEHKQLSGIGTLHVELVSAYKVSLLSLLTSSSLVVLCSRCG
jgi:hypothetical protein